MFLELINHGIWPDILPYKRLQNIPTFRLRSPIVLTRHNNENVLFNRINHFHGVRFLDTKQNFRTQPSRILKTTILLFWAWINENYCNSHFKNVKTIKTTTWNDRMTGYKCHSWKVRTVILKHHFSETGFSKSMANYALRINYKSPAYEAVSACAQEVKINSMVH